MEEIKEDYKEFFANDTTQKFLIATAVLIILNTTGLITQDFFQEIMKWNIGGFWAVNGADFLTNLRG